MNSLFGKVALISGSTSGMGAEEAKLFAPLGRFCNFNETLLKPVRDCKKSMEFMLFPLKT